MMDTSLLVEFIRSKPELLQLPTGQAGAYDHMGALLTDAMLQAGLRYESTVLPRVKKVLAMSEASTTSGFLSILERVGTANLLDWSDSEKPKRLLEITRFFLEDQVETVVDLRFWLQFDVNIRRLKKQRGVGDKTADYFKILAGLEATAIDRHLYKFLEEADCPAKNYSDAQSIIQAAADQLGIPYSLLDHNIWVYMSSKKKAK